RRQAFEAAMQAARDCPGPDEITLATAREADARFAKLKEAIRAEQRAGLFHVTSSGGTLPGARGEPMVGWRNEFQSSKHGPSVKKAQEDIRKPDGQLELQKQNKRSSSLKEVQRKP